MLGALLFPTVTLSPAKAPLGSGLAALFLGPTGAPECPNLKWAELVLPNFGRCRATLVPALVPPLGMWLVAAKAEAVAEPEVPPAL